MTDFDLGKAALENQKRLLNAVSPYLEKPPRNREEVALALAVKALRWISECPDRKGLEAATLEMMLTVMREAAQVTLDAIKQILPEAVP